VVVVRLLDVITEVAGSLDAGAARCEAAKGAAVLAAEATAFGHVVIVAAESIVAHFQSPLKGYDC
jgi:hypothetical protein